MIDTAHIDMDRIDNEHDTLQRLYGFGDLCILCGQPAMPDTMYCSDCWNKWGTEAEDEIHGNSRNLAGY